MTQHFLVIRIDLGHPSGGRATGCLGFLLTPLGALPVTRSIERRLKFVPLAFRWMNLDPVAFRRMIRFRTTGGAVTLALVGDPVMKEHRYSS